MEFWFQFLVYFVVAVMAAWFVIAFATGEFHAYPWWTFILSVIPPAIALGIVERRNYLHTKKWKKPTDG